MPNKVIGRVKMSSIDSNDKMLIEMYKMNFKQLNHMADTGIQFIKYLLIICISTITLLLINTNFIEFSKTFFYSYVLIGIVLVMFIVVTLICGQFLSILYFVLINLEIEYKLNTKWFGFSYIAVIGQIDKKRNSFLRNSAKKFLNSDITEAWILNAYNLIIISTIMSGLLAFWASYPILQHNYYARIIFLLFSFIYYFSLRYILRKYYENMITTPLKHIIQDILVGKYNEMGCTK